MADKRLQPQKGLNVWYIHEKMHFENGTVTIILNNETESYPLFFEDGRLDKFYGGEFRHLETIELSDYIKYPIGLSSNYPSPNNDKFIQKNNYYFSFFNEILPNFGNEIFTYFKDGYLYIWDNNKQFKGAYIVYFYTDNVLNPKGGYMLDERFAYTLINPMDTNLFNDIQIKLRLARNEMAQAQNFYDQPRIRLENAKKNLKLLEEASKTEQKEFIKKWEYLINK